MTGSPTQLGGVASVVGELLKLEDARPDFNVSAVWVNSGSLKRQVLTRFKTRLVGKINRTLSLDPASHPYRFPQINHVRSRPPTFHGNTVLHVHKASLWQQAVRWKLEDPKVALVFHAHSVEGFTGGCVLESDCPSLPKQCTECPIIQSYARGLPRLGFKYRARLLQSAKPLIIANSEATYRVITASGMIPDACRVEIVTPGTDPKVFFSNPAADRARRMLVEGLKIGFVSYSIENPNKGFEDFVQVVRLLKKNFTVCGYAAGEVRPETRQCFPDIQFKGPIHDDSELREFYQSVDYLVVASRSESFGLISIEAQFCGTPVVSYAVGGLPETILDGVTGLVVQPRTPEALTDGIRRLQRQGVLLTHNPGAAHIREFLEKFETNRINAKLAGLYASLFPTMTEEHEN